MASSSKSGKTAPRRFCSEKAMVMFSQMLSESELSSSGSDIEEDSDRSMVPSSDSGDESDINDRGASPLPGPSSPLFSSHNYL